MLKHIIPISLVFIIFSNTGCNMPMSTQGYRPDMLINNYKTINFKNGIKEWTLEAEKASYYFDENSTIAEKIIIYYYKENKQTAEIKADRAVINTNTMNAELSGNVEMLSVTGNRLLTSKIKWNNKNGFLDTDEDIKILRNNGDVIEGTGLRADYNLESYEIKKNVRATSLSLPDTIEKSKK